MKTSIPSYRALFLMGVLPISSLFAQPASVEENAATILKRHGLEHSQVMDHLSWICDVHGPRLTGSTNLKNAQDWIVSRLKEWGLEDAHLEPWGPFGKGWRMDHFSLGVIGSNPWPVHAWPKAWSPSIAERTEADVVYVGDLERELLEGLDLAGKVVLMQTPREVTEPFDGKARRFDAEDLLGMANGSRTTDEARRRAPRNRNRAQFMRRGQLMRIVCAKKPLAILDRGSKGDYGTVFVSGASVPSPDGAPRSERPRPWNPKGAEVIPQFTVAVEHYNRMVRMLRKGVPIKVALELDVTFNDGDPMQYNVIGDIKGKDPALGEQLVMLGAHLDSWHSGTGATDNGCGSAVMLEATRLLTELVKEKGQAPRRTIRLALWSGEEQGLLGSRAYVNQHFAVSGGRGRPPSEIKPEHAKLSGYFNLDNGTGRIRGVYLQRNEAVGPIFRDWLRPFNDVGAATITLNNTGGTDHQSFDGVGLPVAYSTRTHHSNMDNWDHAVAEDLKQAATVVASFVWNAAMRDEMLPRKPIPPASGTGARRGN